MRKLVKLSLSLALVPMLAAALCAALFFGVAPRSASAHPLARHHSTPFIHVHLRNHSNSTSTNWSGYATTGTTYSDVKASWTQPTGSCSSTPNAYSAFWVGIDGDGTNSVEQTGSEVDCSGGSPVYYAWYEMYPQYPVNYSNTVRPGDSISAEVKYTGGKFVLSISDSTQGWSHSVTKKSNRAQRGSAEWIAEAPSSSSGVLPLADFGTVNFSSCTANGVAISSNPNPDEIVMVTSGGTVKAQPSGLSGGTAFSVTWKHS